MTASIQPDLALFIEHATWLAHVQRLTRLGLIAWLRQRLTVRAAERIRERLPLDHPIQRAAERAVVDVLRKRVERRVPRFRVEDVPSRLVDWPRTYMTTPGVTPSCFWTREPTAVPDSAVLGALATMASTWIQLLVDRSTSLST